MPHPSGVYHPGFPPTGFPYHGLPNAAMGAMSPHAARVFGSAGFGGWHGCENGGCQNNQPPPTESWSKPTTPKPSSSPNGARPRPSRRGPASDLGDPSEPGGDPSEDGDPPPSSTAGTSEVRSMLKRRARKEIEGRPKSSLGSVKIEEFYGDRSRYLKWKRAIEAQQHLYGLENAELSMLVYLSTRREARDVVEQHPITSYTGSGGLHLLWQVLDEAFGESEAELFERADRELEKCRRQPAVSQWPITWQRCVA